MRPNKYEPGRAHVVIFNWEDQSEVLVELADVLEVGQRFRIVSARNFYGPSVAEGTYSGRAVAVSMVPVAPDQPVGMADYELPTVEPQFGCFVVLPE